MSRVDPHARLPSVAEGDDAALAEQLDRYQHLLDSGNDTQRMQFLQQHPELISYCKQLDALCGLAYSATDARMDAANEPAEQRMPLGSSAASSDSPPGETFPRPFGKFELLEEIGRGGMGVVYKARQRDLDRLVAVKMILPSRIPSGAELRRFYREAKSAGCLKSPYVIEVYELGEHDGQHYFAMPYIEGGNLADLTERQRMPADDAARLLAQVADGVQCLHEHGLVHRDLKPSNILLDPAGRPYVADFGLAKFCAGRPCDTRTGTVVGTPGYMAPEQAAGRIHEVSPASDVFSLGAILYHMLTGQPPFAAATPWETVLQVIEADPVSPRQLDRSIPYDLELICRRALEKDPTLRYSSAGAMGEDLRRFLRREAIEATAGNFWHRLRRWARNQPALAAHWIGLGVLATVVQTRYIYRSGDEMYHGRVIGTIALWAVVSLILQRLVQRSDSKEHPNIVEQPAVEDAANRSGKLSASVAVSKSDPGLRAIDHADWARFAWATCDVILLTLILWTIAAPVAPLLIGYPVLIAAAGMFFRVRLVTFTTTVCALACSALIWRRADLQMPIHYALLLILQLIVLGGIVAYQIRRIRILNRYFQRQV